MVSRSTRLAAALAGAAALGGLLAACVPPPPAPPPALKATGTVSEQFAQVGADVYLTITVENTTTSPINNVALEALGNKIAYFQNGKVEGAPCSAAYGKGTTATCAIGALQPGQKKDVTLRYAPLGLPILKSGEFTITSNITGDGVATTVNKTKVNFYGSACTVVGTPKNDLLIVGTPLNDVLCGLAGNDVLLPGAGNDTNYPGSGQDNVDTGTGSDYVALFAPGTGNATVGGSPGVNDKVTVDFANAPNAVTVDLKGLKNAQEQGGQNRFANLSDIHTVVGSKYGDTVKGLPAPEDLRGGPGNDTLVGGGGADKLDGGPGSDSCSGDGSETKTNCES